MHVYDSIGDAVIAGKRRLAQLQHKLNLAYGTHSLSTLDTLVARGRITNPLKEKILRCVAIAEDVYPDNVDFSFIFKEETDSFTNTYGSNHTGNMFYVKGFSIVGIDLKIKFPTVNIVNSKDERHTIRDLIVVCPIKFKPSGNGFKLEIETIKGGKLTFTKSELLSGYVHSHLPGIGHDVHYRFKFNGFCTGSGEINMTQSLLNATFDWDMFKLYLMQIKPFIEWESIEGGPHRNMREIFTRNYDIPRFPRRDIERLMGRLNATYDYTQETLDWTFRRNTAEIVDNEKFEDFLARVAPVEFYKDPSGKHFTKRNTSDTNVVASHYTLMKTTFKGETLSLSIAEEPALVQTNNKKYVNPQIKKDVKQHLENRVQKQIAIQAGIRRLNKGYHSY